MAASVWNLATRHGLLDLSFTPSGFPGGYVALAPGATLMPAAGTSISVLVASLDDCLDLDPFGDDGSAGFPVTLGDFVKLYEHAVA